MDLNSTEVLIDGIVYHLSSHEDEAYLQKVAAYLNEKIGTIKKDRSYGHLSPEYQSLLIELNLADDYFKEQARMAELEEEKNSLEKDSYNLKHELVTLQMKVDSLQSEKDALQEELDKEKTRKANSRKRTKSAKAEETETVNTAAGAAAASPSGKDEPEPEKTEQPVKDVKAEAAPKADISQSHPTYQKQPQKNASAYKGGSGGTKH